MNPHFFLFNGSISPERLSWLEECLKYYFLKLTPEDFLHHKKTPDGLFTFLLTGESLYSLRNPETAMIWEIILSLPSVRIICDKQELLLRGISIESLKMKHPTEITDNNRQGVNRQQSFWNDVANIACHQEQPVPDTIGYLQIRSPYMHRSANAMVQCLTAALENQSSVELYAYMDGVHVAHSQQNPTEFENIGEGLEGVAKNAAKRNLACRMIACDRSATARGYSTWETGNNQIVSACTIESFRIRNLNETIGRLQRDHIILGEDVGSIQFKKRGLPGPFSIQEENKVPPVTILVTHLPYGTGMAFGAISLGVACAAKGIPSNIIFLENGVYALSGTHQVDENSRIFNLQNVIDSVAGSENLQFFAYTPSFQQRDLMKNPRMNAVLDIGADELGKILFNPSVESQAGHQRLLFF